MPKGYWIASVTVTNPDKYKEYADLAPAAFKKFGGKYLARGGKHVVLEGDGRARNVVIEFDSLEAAQNCHRSPEYQAARAKREGAAIMTMVIVEGVE